MKKSLLIFAVFLFVVGAVYAQTRTESPLPQMDTAVRVLANDINRRLGLERAVKIAAGQFSYRDSLPALGAYWKNQLGEELTNIPNRTFVVLADGAAGAEWAITGEIVEIGNTIRIYTRLIRLSDRSVAASFHSDFERSQFLIEMLAGGGSAENWAARDVWEPDNMGSPVSTEVGTGESPAVTARSLHYNEDEDFFLLLPGADGRLVVETSGGMDTLLELYDADTGEKLRENDDGGSGGNARIRQNVQAGKRYIAKVRGYSGATGQYSFRAHLSGEAAFVPDEHEDDNDSPSAKWIGLGAPQQHTFHTGDDEDWVKFQIERSGRYTIRARGVESTSLDTAIELFDVDMNSLGEDDDGGVDYDSRLSLRLESGLYYLKVRCLDSEPEEPYNISVNAE